MVVLKNGKRVRSEHLELRGLASHSHSPRVGIIVPKYRQLAVDRNRLKRRLREIVRLHVLPNLDNVELIIRAGPSAYQASMNELRAELVEAVKKLTS